MSKPKNLYDSIGALIDAWELLPNDLKSDLREASPAFTGAIKGIAGTTAENNLYRRAFETDDLLRLPEVGNLNALQIVKKLAELSDRLTSVRADAIGKLHLCGEVAHCDTCSAVRDVVELEQLKEKL